MSPATMLYMARRSAKLTQAEVARRAGMAQSEVARIERPGSNPRFDTLERLLGACGYRLRATPGLPDLDETQIVEQLRLSPRQRIEQHDDAKRGIDALRRAAARDRG